MHRQFAVIGLGYFGATVARELRRHDHEVLGIDADEKQLNAIADLLNQAVVADPTVFKAIAVALAAMLLIFSMLFGLTITDPDHDFLSLAFETVSAFGTVGLSHGLTSELSSSGQLLLIATMLLGRTGPLALGYLLATRSRQGIGYARTELSIG